MDRPRLLLVDDEPTTAWAVNDWLQRLGYVTRYVTGPDAADTALAEDKFDLILSDIHMPGNCRLEWIARITGAPCAPPVVLMTGNPEFATAHRAANLPVAAYVLKPLDYPAVAATLAQLATAHRERLALAALANHLRDALAAAPPAEIGAAPQLYDLLRALADQVGQAGPPHWRETSSGSVQTVPWRNAVLDALGVIEKTKHSFKSKDLGQLRVRLTAFLERHTA